jgi:hypothetical protein
MGKVFFIVMKILLDERPFAKSTLAMNESEA